MDSKFNRDQLISRCLKLKQEYVQLSLPILKKANIEVTFNDNESIDEINFLTRFPVMETQYINANIKELHLLNENQGCEFKNENACTKKLYTNDENKYKIFEACLEFKTNEDIEFLPGDSIGVLIGNYDNEVNEVINLLDLDNKKEQLITITSSSKTILFPQKSTLFQLIKFCVEIRSIPKKVALLSFSEFCSDPNEKDCLILLCSKEGSKLYDEFILEKHFGIFDLLRNFKSCKPDLKTFLNHSINFVPRYYSVIEFNKIVQSVNNGSIDESTKEQLNIYNYKLKIAFNVTSFPLIYNRSGTQLFGIFTGKMNQIYENKKKNSIDLVNKMKNLSIDSSMDLSLYIFKRKNLMFRLSDMEREYTVIMISIGTGIAPFLSLIKYLEKLNKDQLDLKLTGSQLNILKPKTYLIHGCRTKKDCLYYNELAKSKAINHLKICCSREDDGDKFKYVQDYLKTELKDELKDLILNSKKTKIYICGDQIKFTKDVLNVLTQIIDQPDAEIILKKMQKDKRILFDSWI